MMPVEGSFRPAEHQTRESMLMLLGWHLQKEVRIDATSTRNH